MMRSPQKLYVNNIKKYRNHLIEIYKLIIDFSVSVNNLGICLHKKKCDQDEYSIYKIYHLS